jgi:sulfur carrier protein
MPPAFLSSHQIMKVILPDQGIRVMEHSPETVGALLHEIGANPLEVIVSRNGKLVPEEAAIGGDDEIRIIRIAHGG